MRVSLATIALQFAILSLLAFGGANAVAPEMHRLAVDSRHWMSDPEFASLFAIAQSAPGPNVMIVTLIGWKIAGLAGALTATAAMCGPSCVLTYFAVKLWDQAKDAPWRAWVARALTPMTIGLVASAAWLLSRGADRTWKLAGVTIAVAAAAYFSRLNPLWLLGAGAALGLAGLLT